MERGCGGVFLAEFAFVGVKSGGLFCVSAFVSNLASVAVKMFYI
jgi:hypothetical protein